MKKTIFVLAFLIVSVSLFSQELRLWGNLLTGMKLETGQGSNDKTPWEPRWKSPTLSLFHDDAGAARFELAGEAATQNQGLVFKMRFNPVEIYKWGWNDDRIDELLNNCYIWFNLFENRVRFSAGIIRDGEWWWSEGTGFRLTFRATGQLRLGTMIDIQPRAFYPWTTYTYVSTAANEYHSVEKPGVANKWYDDEGLIRPVLKVLERTAFGGSYNHRDFDLYFGIKGGGDSFPMQISEWDYNLQWVSRRGNFDFDHDWIGLKAGFGLNIKSVKNFIFEFGTEGHNLAKFNQYGWVQTRQKIGYRGLYDWVFELYADQRFFGNRSLIRWGNFSSTDRMENEIINPRDGFNFDVYRDPKPFFHINPSVRYQFNNKLNGGLRIPIDIWPENVFSININPNGEFHVAPWKFIQFQYKFITNFYDNTLRHTNDGGTIKPFYDHIIQINFMWFFG